MKALKITLILAIVFATFTSCTKQDLNEDDVLIAPEIQNVHFTGGGVDDV
ncbi:MAG: hypothetical protein GW817_00020 [Flavobacteriales bacterium]|nr:hypothetical protein [Flavobacteriales bacterium]NCQ13996.1 hypothetical protein [Flavobacteriales bacterium]